MTVIKCCTTRQYPVVDSNVTHMQIDAVTSRECCLVSTLSKLIVDNTSLMPFFDMYRILRTSWGLLFAKFGELQNVS